MTDELLDGDGISYMGPSSAGFVGVEHSYLAFGNDGMVYNVAINALLSGREQPADVLDALHDFSDHLPVVADYQFPARMEVTVDPISAALIVGATASVDFDVANTAPVALEVAADELDYSFFTSGDLIGFWWWDRSRCRWRGNRIVRFGCVHRGRQIGHVDRRWTESADIGSGVG